MGKWKLFSREKEREEETRYILSIDGGGMRGIIPAHILARLDALIKAEGDERPLYSHFDLIAGTSTGALLALALALPADSISIDKEKGEDFLVRERVKEGLFRKEKLIDKGYIARHADPAALERIYLDEGESIFPRKSTLSSLFGPIFTEKYSIDPFNSFLYRKFRDTELKDADVPVMAISFSTLDDQIFAFRSWDSHGFSAVEAARASSAAPLYFPPAKLKDRETGKDLVLIDGGVAANNPSLIAYSEARKLYPDATRFVVLSLSTCSPDYSFDATESSGFTGLMNSPFSKMVMDAQLKVVHQAMESIPGVEYIRIWSPAIEKKIKLDDASKESLSLLLNAAETTYIAKEPKLRNLARKLGDARTPDSVRLREIGSFPLLSQQEGSEENGD